MRTIADHLNGAAGLFSKRSILRSGVRDVRIVSPCIMHVAAPCVLAVHFQNDAWQGAVLFGSTSALCDLTWIGLAYQAGKLASWHAILPSG